MVCSGCGEGLRGAGGCGCGRAGGEGCVGVGGGWRGMWQGRGGLGGGAAASEAGRAVFGAGSDERGRFCGDLEREGGRGDLFGVAGRLAGRDGDVVGAGCVRGGGGKVVVGGRVGGGLGARCGVLSGGGFAWDGGVWRMWVRCVGLVGGGVSEAGAAVGGMRRGGSGGPTGVVSEMLGAAGGTGAVWMTDVCGAVVGDGGIPEDWSRGWMVGVCGGRGGALACGSCRGIGLLGHAVKVLERVIEGGVRGIVGVGGMRFGFMAGGGTTDAVFIVRQLRGRCLVGGWELWMAFVDLERALGGVPGGGVVWWALGCVGVWMVSVMGAVCEDATAGVRLSGRESGTFSVGVGVHRGSVLGPLLFIIVLGALSGEFGEGLPMGLLCADGLVLVAELEMEGLRRWGEKVLEKNYSLQIVI